MCSPKPWKGAGGGLSEFWSCLDSKQRDSLLTINGRAVQEALDCSLCRDLAKSATLALEEGDKCACMVAAFFYSWQNWEDFLEK